jgi:hypothetical protein
MKLSRLLPIAALLFSIASPAKAEQIPYEYVKTATTILAVSMLESLDFPELAKELQVSNIVAEIPNHRIDDFLSLGQALCRRVARDGDRLTPSVLAREVRAMIVQDIKEIPEAVERDSRRAGNYLKAVAIVNSEIGALAMVECGVN